MFTNPTHLRNQDFINYVNGISEKNFYKYQAYEIRERQEKFRSFLNEIKDFHISKSPKIADMDTLRALRKYLMLEERAYKLIEDYVGTPSVSTLMSFINDKNADDYFLNPYTILANATQDFINNLESNDIDKYDGDLINIVSALLHFNLADTALKIFINCYKHNLNTDVETLFTNLNQFKNKVDDSKELNDFIKKVVLDLSSTMGFAIYTIENFKPFLVDNQILDNCIDALDSKLKIAYTDFELPSNKELAKTLKSHIANIIDQGSREDFIYACSEYIKNRITDVRMAYGKSIYKPLYINETFVDGDKLNNALFAKKDFNPIKYYSDENGVFYVDLLPSIKEKETKNLFLARFLSALKKHPEGYTIVKDYLTSYAKLNLPAPNADLVAFAEKNLYKNFNNAKDLVDYVSKLPCKDLSLSLNKCVLSYINSKESLAGKDDVNAICSNLSLSDFGYSENDKRVKILNKLIDAYKKIYEGKEIPLPARLQFVAGLLKVPGASDAVEIQDDLLALIGEPVKSDLEFLDHDSRRENLFSIMKSLKNEEVKFEIYKRFQGYRSLRDSLNNEMVSYVRNLSEKDQIAFIEKYLFPDFKENLTDYFVSEWNLKDITLAFNASDYRLYKFEINNSTEINYERFSYLARGAKMTSAYFTVGPEVRDYLVRKSLKAIAASREDVEGINFTFYLDGGYIIASTDVNNLITDKRLPEGVDANNVAILKSDTHNFYVQYIPSEHAPLQKPKFSLFKEVVPELRQSYDETINKIARHYVEVIDNFYTQVKYENLKRQNSEKNKEFEYNINSIHDTIEDLKKFIANDDLPSNDFFLKPLEEIDRRIEDVALFVLNDPKPNSEIRMEIESILENSMPLIDNIVRNYTNNLKIKSDSFSSFALDELEKTPRTFERYSKSIIYKLDGILSQKVHWQVMDMNTEMNILSNMANVDKTNNFESVASKPELSLQEPVKPVKKENIVNVYDNNSLTAIIAKERQLNLCIQKLAQIIKAPEEQKNELRKELYRDFDEETLESVSDEMILDFLNVKYGEKEKDNSNESPMV